MSPSVDIQSYITVLSLIMSHCTTVKLVPHVKAACSWNGCHMTLRWIISGAFQSVFPISTH